VARWVALAWLLVWVPTYWRAWGVANFFLLCDIAVFLAVLGFWQASPLLLSSQAVATPVLGLVWLLDVSWRLLTGAHLLGGTEYMWATDQPLWVRLLSLFHVLLPVALFWAVRRVGYDPRGWQLQAAVAAAAMIASRFFDPAKNMNYAFRDPFFHREWGPAPLHVAIVWAVTVAAVYWPTHCVLVRILPSAEKKDELTR